jgi:hypothetical protein
MITTLITVVAGATPAHATPDYAFVGNCLWQAPTELGDVTVLQAYVVAYAPSPIDGPATLTHVDCKAYVNGNLRATVPVAAVGNVAVLAPTLLAVDHGRGDVLTICTTAVYANAVPDTTCADVAPDQLVPQPVFDLAEAAPLLVAQSLCPVLRSFAPIQVQNYARLEADGDVVVNGVKYYDCPTTP